LVCPPQPGDQVLVLAQEGDAEHGVIAGGVFGGPNRPPEGVAAGELWLVHGSGTFLQLRNDGSVHGQAQVWQLQGDLHVQGDIYDQHGALSALRSHYDGHHHIDSRGGTTSTPDQQD
jgi:phage baseplate assembly protein gpV